jgi:hypothetical protein
MQGAGFGGFSANLQFSGVNQGQPTQTRNIMSASIAAGQERITSPVAPVSSGMMQQELGIGYSAANHVL